MNTDNIFDWNHLSTDEIVDELCAGSCFLSRDNLLSVVATMVYQLNFSDEEITKRIDQIAQLVHIVPDLRPTDD